MIKPIIIALMLVSTAAFAAERTLTEKVANITGCAEVLIGELLPERKAVLTEVKNLSSQLILIARIQGKTSFEILFGNSFDDLDASLAKIASQTLENNANALKPEQLRESLAALRSRLHESFNDQDSRALSKDDEHVSYAEPEKPVAKEEFFSNGSTPGDSRTLIQP